MVLGLDLCAQNKAVREARFRGMMPGVADWLRPKQVLACLWGLGTDTVLWEMAQQTVSYERALLGEEKTREQGPGAPFCT